MPRGQSSAAQQARLAKQCCPVHGGGLGQASPWLSSLTRKQDADDYTLACCPRADCDVVAKITKANFEDGPAIVVTAADVDPELWMSVWAWVEHKRTRGPK